MPRPMSRNTFATPAPHLAAPDCVQSAVATRLIEADRPVRGLRARLAYGVVPVLAVVFGAALVASAQSSSPFANKKRTQAWELPEDPTAAPAPTPTAATSRATPTRPGGLRLRSRALDPDTAAAPPPGAAPVPAPSEPVSSRPARRSAAPVPSPKPAAPSQSASIPEPNSNAAPAPVFAPSATPPLPGPPNASAVPSQAEPGPWRPYSGAPAATDSGAYAPSAVPSSVPPQPGLAGGTYAGVPRASVNSAASRSQVDDTDYTVHRLAPQPWQADPYLAQDYGYRGHSPNPTAGDFGYGRTAQAPTGPQGGSQGGSPIPPQGGSSVPPMGGSPVPPGGYPPGSYQGGPFDSPVPGPAPKQTFFQRIGLGAVTSMIRGALRGGVAARENDGWEEAFVGDADIEIELAAVTRSGLEWGIHGQARAQYDEGRRGFTRRLPDCPPTLAGCASIQVPGVPVPAGLRGHTSQFYTTGPDVAKDGQIALESAHVFLRSAYGDVTVGRDDGAAFLFSLGAPTLLNVGASNSGVDYTGLDAVKTVNDASGFSEKLTYTTPRLGGDQVGFGIQLGASYAPDADACGVDYCVDLNDVENVVAPDIADIMEAGIALDRTFAPGVSAELTGTYARGKEQSGLVGLDDLEAFGAGLEFVVQDWTLGGSVLKSNQGLENGDYTAYDVGLTWKPSAIGFTLGYGHAEDDLVSLKSDQFTGGVSYDINERIRIGAGAQYVDRDTLRNVNGTAQTVGEKAAALFIEGGITF